MDGGLDRMTTTRVAARAGVSVGSLYQYYPNKHSLLAAVLEEYLAQVVKAVEDACRHSHGQSTTAMASAVVEAFFKVKFAEPGVSHALHAVAVEVSGEEVVRRATLRSQKAFEVMLTTASDRHFADPALTAFVLSTVGIGPVQALLSSQAPPHVVDAVRRHLTSMTIAYLREVGVSRKPAVKVGRVR